MSKHHRFNRHTLQKAIHLTLGSTVLLALWLSACFRQFTFMVPAYVTGLSAVAFALYAEDKRRARTQQFRISEATLHMTELVGGWPGALMAQVIFRHKTRKLPFQLITWTIVAIYAILGYSILYYGTIPPA